jgi:RNA polymerase sigma-70 factor (family 1)
MKLSADAFHAELPALQQQVSEGIEPAFEKIYLYYRRRLLAFAFGYLHSRELAEELVEDVFVKLWCSRASVPGIRNLTVYLYAAVKNRALNALSRESRGVPTDPFELAENDGLLLLVTPHDLLVTSEVMQQMQAAVESLPERCRLIFRLIREDGLRYKEVAEILGISVNTIDAQMAIAVKRICHALQVTVKK